MEALILPKRYDLTCMSLSYRKRSEEVRQLRWAGSPT